MLRIVDDSGGFSRGQRSHRAAKTAPETRSLHAVAGLPKNEFELRKPT